MIPVTCTYPGIFFCPAWGRSRPDDQKTALTKFYLLLSLFLSLQRGANGFITEKTIYFSKDLEWVQHFEGVRGGGGGPENPVVTVPFLTASLLG